jgi:hypothetical protein
VVVVPAVALEVAAPFVLPEAVVAMHEVQLLAERLFVGLQLQPDLDQVFNLFLADLHIR